MEGPGTDGAGGSARARAWEMACLMKRPAAALSTTREPVDSYKKRHVSYGTIFMRLLKKRGGAEDYGEQGGEPRTYVWRDPRLL